MKPTLFSLSFLALAALAAPASAASAPLSAEDKAFCAKAKDKAKCETTRALVAQLKKDRSAAKWDDRVDFKYAKNDEENNLLFEFMLENTLTA